MTAHFLAFNFSATGAVVTSARLLLSGEQFSRIKPQSDEEQAGADSTMDH